MRPPLNLAALLTAIFGDPWPLGLCHGEQLAEHLHRVVRSLPPREAQVILHRYSLVPKTFQTLTHVIPRARATSTRPLTQERMGQLHARAIRKLRHPTRQRGWRVICPGSLLGR